MSSREIFSFTIYDAIENIAGILKITIISIIFYFNNKLFTLFINDLTGSVLLYYNIASTFYFDMLHNLRKDN